MKKVATFGVMGLLVLVCMSGGEIFGQSCPDCTINGVLDKALCTSCDAGTAMCDSYIVSMSYGCCTTWPTEAYSCESAGYTDQWGQIRYRDVAVDFCRPQDICIHPSDPNACPSGVCYHKPQFPGEDTWCLPIGEEWTYDWQWVCGVN